MKKSLAIIIMITQTAFCLGQKKQIDTTAVAKWQPTSDYFEQKISNDGKWAHYRIRYDNKFGMSGDVIKSLHDLKEYKLPVSTDFFYPFSFTEDSRYAVGYYSNKKELLLLRLGEEASKKIFGVTSVQLVGDRQNSFIIYESTDNPEVITVLSAKTGDLFVYKNIRSKYIINNILLLTVKTQLQDKNQLWLVDLKSKKHQVIWEGEGIPTNFVMEDRRKVIGFICKNEIWLYDEMKKSQAVLLRIPKPANNSDLTLDGIDRFAGNGEFLVLDYKGSDAPNINSGASSVQIFSFQDPIFALNNRFKATLCKFAYKISESKLVPLKGEGVPNRYAPVGDCIKLNRQQYGGGPEYYWNKKQVKVEYVYNLKDNQQRGPDIENSKVTEFSLDGCYCIYQPNLGDFYSLNISTGQVVNLTEKLPIPLVDNVDESLRFSTARNLEFVNWVSSLSNPNLFIAYDHYDIWLIDASNKSKPVCLTGSYGRLNKIVLRLVDENVFSPSCNKIYLSAYDETTKDAGFYKINCSGSVKPVKLTMGAFLYGKRGRKVAYKAKDADIWLVQRESSSEFPNLFWTADFIAFHEVSNLHPEKEYNWHSTELVNFVTNNGVKSQAILYKPADFDSTKKYPVLFNFYESEYYKLNEFLKPDYTHVFEFNIPLMLAHGYLVCVPDIHFNLGEPAQSIVECVEGAADEISKRLYVDKNRLGASGGSFGGYGINCLAAFSKRFKALVSISGISDLISNYGNVPGLRSDHLENAQLRMGMSLSADPERYLINSPITFAKDVTTPVLIVNTLLDANVNVQQGIEWFISLRREGKASWMLRYQIEEHGIQSRCVEENKDLYVRMTQFFDHYLKGTPTPKWMMDSLNIHERSGEEGFKLMPSGVEPGPGLNTEEDLKRRREYIQSKQIQ